MTAYYNEIDPFAAAWLRELIKAGLIAPGDVDERSIHDVRPQDLAGYTQCHFFAGIGGWSYALRLAGWPDDRPVWTGSCPCQPFSAAGKQAGTKDDRHLWPEFFRLIRECRPEVVFGEQVASSEVVGTQLEADFVIAIWKGEIAKANRIAKRLVRSSSFHYWPRWLDLVRGDLEKIGYTMRPEILGAHSVGAPHIRQRLWFVADSLGERLEERPEPHGAAIEPGQQAPRRADVGGRGDAGELAESNRLAGGQGCAIDGRRDTRGDAEPGTGLGGGELFGELANTDRTSAARFREHSREGKGKEWIRGGPCHRFELGDTERHGLRIGGRSSTSIDNKSSYWTICDWLPCRDGKARPVEPGTFPLVARLPDSLVPSGDPGESYAQASTEARVGRLRGYGNSINVYVAKEFIEAYRETSIQAQESRWQAY